MSTAHQIVDHNDFSTETGHLKPGESDFRNEICLNGKWDFQPVDLPDGFRAGESIPELPYPHPDRWESVKLKIPSPWNINGLADGDGVPGGDFNCYPSYPESWKHVKMGWMRRTLRVPEDWSDKSILLHFEAVCGTCQVYIDGRQVGEHFDNSMPKSYPLDAFVTPGQDHELWVGVRAPELMNINSGPTKYTYPTGSFFNTNTTGIWQDVVLLGLPQVRVQDVYIQPDLSADRLRIQVTIKNRSDQSASLTVNGVVKALKPFSFPQDGIQVVPHYDLEDKPVIQFPSAQITVAAGTKAVLTLKTTVSERLGKWDTDNPTLYASLVTLEQDEKTVDRKYTRFGWREFKIKNGDFYLNEDKIQVKGDSWHFMGIPQLTRRYAFAWYRALKDAGGNGVRLHAMPYPTFYLEMADEMGVCVLDESAIWASHCQFNYDEPVTWERFYDHMTSLVLRDRNYPSVMGWSVENEIRMALARYSPTEETINAMQEKVCKLMDIVRELDPTRDWISADGSLDWFGRFPTCMIHYGPQEMYAYIKEEAGKPVGVGEGTIAYSGTPVHASAFVGDLAFRSIKDRMKGVAVQSYGDLKAQLLADFSYLSVFNLAWYGLKPLPLGHANQEKAPTVDNGILFGSYQEGKPGVQPERLGPYCSTFNPGYDPDLPLYSPWPMYEAIKAVFSPGGPLPSPYETETAAPPQKPLPQIDRPKPVVVIGGPGRVYYQGLQESGVQFSEDQTGTFLFADLASISPEQEMLLRARMESLKASGGTVLLAGLTPASERLLENLTGEKIEVFAREASSLVFAGEYANTDPLVDHFSLQELYFSEAEDYIVQRYGIRGDGLQRAQALLQACSCDWRMWNHRGESSKTGALYRSEKELPEANALVKLDAGKATILLCTLEMSGNPSALLRLSSARKLLWNRLLKAAGAEVGDDFGKQAQALEGDTITRVLAVGFSTERDCEFLLNTDFIGGENKAAPRHGDAIIGDTLTTHWQVESAQADGFRFREMAFAGPKAHSASYMSFYLHSPRRIDDLLSEPNVPELYLNVETACCIRIWLNGKEILTQADVSAEPIRLQARLFLGKGSNQILIKVVNTDTDYVVRAYLSSTHEDYIAELGSSVER
jgi:beta-galactosidase